MPNVRWLLAAITDLHRFVYLTTHGWLGSRVFWMRFLLLFHVGRRSGLRRITPLLCIVDAQRWIVVASNAGDDRTPAWWLNLLHKPEVMVQLGRERVAARAREVSDAEYETMWAQLQAAYPYYDNYRTRTRRKIPVVVLERCDPA